MGESFIDKVKGDSLTSEAKAAIRTVKAAGLHWQMSKTDPKSDTFFIGIRLLPDALMIVSELGVGLSETICQTYQQLLELLPAVAQAAKLKEAGRASSYPPFFFDTRILAERVRERIAELEQGKSDD